MPRARYTRERYLELCKAKHGDKYDYARAKFGILRDNITITCPEHGDFSLVTSSHLRHGRLSILRGAPRSSTLP